MPADRRSQPPAEQLSMALSVRLSSDQRQILERIATRHDLTLSGAVRHVLDLELDRVYKRGAPTMRELLHENDEPEIEIAGERHRITRMEPADA
jgi:hypothetical protein